MKNKNESDIQTITEKHDEMALDLEMEISQLNEKLEDEQNAHSLTKLAIESSVNDYQDLLSEQKTQTEQKIKEL
jgi:hypothetical protein